MKIEHVDLLTFIDSEIFDLEQLPQADFREGYIYALKKVRNEIIKTIRNRGVRYDGA